MVEDGDDRSVDWRTVPSGGSADVVHYRGHSRIIQQPGWWPEVEGRGEAVFVGVDNDVWSAALEDMKRELGETEDTPARVSGAAE